MKREHRQVPVALAAIVWVTGASGATRIVLNSSSAAASSTYSNRDPKYAVNGAGLDGDTHTSTNADFLMWMSTSGQAVSGQWFRVDLGQVTPLDHFKIWNFNWRHPSVATTNRSVRDAEVYLSSLGTTPGTDFSDGAQWTRVINKVTFGRGPGLDTYTGEPDVSLQGLQGRWLALRVLSNYNMADLAVGISEMQVFAAAKPATVAVPPTDVGSTQASLTGALTFDGGFSANVFAYWGTTDGGTVSSAWDHVVSLGVRPVGSFSTNVAVSSDSEYFFRAQAVTVGGEGWSTPGSFITAPVTVELPTRVSEGGGTVPVTFRRPAALTNTAITVNFSISGTAAAGQDYIAPATSIVIQAGANTAQTQIQLVDDLVAEPNETLTVGIGPSSCTLSAASTNSTTITDDDGVLDTSDWHQHMKLTLSGYSGSTALTNFPYALQLSEQISGFRYADFASPSNGGDLRVTDGSTGQALPYEIETWDPSGTSVVWVCLPVLASPTNALRVHWGNSGAVLPSYTTNGVAWPNSFGGVWHMREAGARDSTANHNNGTAHGNVTVPGLLGQGQYFNGYGSNYIQVLDAASIGSSVTGSLTVSTWLKSDVTLTKTNETWRMLEKGDDYFFGQGFGSAGGMVFILKQNDGATGLGNSADIASNEWHYACGTFDGSMMRLYIDGVQAGTHTLAGVIDDDKLPLRIGSDDSGKYFLGVMDETRIESVPRSADWVKACYDSQRKNAAFGVCGPVTHTVPKGTCIAVH